MKTLTTKVRKTSTIAIAALFGMSLMASEASTDIVFARQNITPQLGAAAANLDLDGNIWRASFIAF